MLMYQHVSESSQGDGRSGDRIPAETFARHLDYLLAKGYEATTLSKALSRQRPAQKNRPCG